MALSHAVMLCEGQDLNLQAEHVTPRYMASPATGKSLDRKSLITVCLAKASLGCK